MKKLLCLFAIAALTACPALASPADHPTGIGISRTIEPPDGFLFESARQRHAAQPKFREPVIVIRAQATDRFESLVCPDALTLKPEWSASLYTPGVNHLAYRNGTHCHYCESRQKCGGYSG